MLIWVVVPTVGMWTSATQSSALLVPVFDMNLAPEVLCLRYSVENLPGVHGDLTQMLIWVVVPTVEMWTSATQSSALLVPVFDMNLAPEVLCLRYTFENLPGVHGDLTQMLIWVVKPVHVPTVETWTSATQSSALLVPVFDMMQFVLPVEVILLSVLDMMELEVLTLEV